MEKRAKIGKRSWPWNLGKGSIKQSLIFEDGDGGRDFNKRGRLFKKGKRYHLKK